MARPRKFRLVIGFLALLPALAAQFIVPNQAQRSAALGSLDGLPALLRRALDAKGFEPIKPPAAMDWLANHQEPGQRVDEFINSRPNVPDSRRNKIYLMLIGRDRYGGPPIAKLAEFSRAFFGLQTVEMPRLDLGKVRVTKRRIAGGNSEQILTTDMLAILKQRLPDDAFALLGVTMSDLYPAPDWNYVFGQASFARSCGSVEFRALRPRESAPRLSDSGARGGAHVRYRTLCLVSVRDERV